jgi:hypothetical protein
MRGQTFLLSLTFVLALTAAAVACPACKDTVANTDAQTAGSVGAGFNASIYVMLGGFFVALGMVIRTIVRGMR